MSSASATSALHDHYQAIFPLDEWTSLRHRAVDHALLDGYPHVHISISCGAIGSGRQGRQSNGAGPGSGRINAGPGRSPRRAFAELSVFHVNVGAARSLCRSLVTGPRTSTWSAPTTLGDLWRRPSSIRPAFAHVPRHAKPCTSASRCRFPRLVLAVLGRGVELIEADARKCAFLREPRIATAPSHPNGTESRRCLRASSMS